MKTQEINRPSHYIYPGTVSLTKIKKYILKIVKEQVCHEYNITMEQIRVHNRTREYTEPRHIIAYLLHKILKNNITLGEMGRELNSHHATVIYAIKKTQNWMETNKDFRNRVIRIQTKIGCMY